MERAINLHELVVANFRTKHLSPEILDWFNSNDIAIAESCSRQAYFGLKKDFESFPPLADSNALKYFQGASAYRFLLRLACGLESARQAEDNIKGQLFEGWSKFEASNPETYKTLDTIMQQIKADSRYVSAAGLAHYKVYTHETVARDISGQEKGETMLLVASRGRHGGISSFSEKLMRVCGNNRNGRVDEIIVTSPETADLSYIFDEMLSLKRRGILAVDIKRASFPNFTRYVEQADHVYVDIAMGTHPDVEMQIISAWQNRVSKSNNLTLLRGDPTNNGASSGLWRDAGLDSYISPEDIRAAMTERMHTNIKAVADSECALEYCITLREKGESPSHAKVRDHLNLRSIDQPQPVAA